MKSFSDRAAQNFVIYNFSIYTSPPHVGSFGVLIELNFFFIADTAPLIEREDDDLERHAWRYYSTGKAMYMPFSERLRKEEEAYTYVSIAEG